MFRLIIAATCACFVAVSVHGAPTAVVHNPGLTCPQTEMGDADLQSRYEKIWEQYSESVDQATNKLRTELEKQVNTASDTGNLNLTLFWTDLAKQYDQTGDLQWDDSSHKKTWVERFGDAPFPRGFNATVKKTSEAHAAANQDLQNGYDELVKELTKAKKVPEALKVRSEIKELMTEKTAAPEPKPEPEQKAKVQKGPKDGKYRYVFAGKPWGLLFEVRGNKLFLCGDVTPNGDKLHQWPSVRKYRESEEFKLEDGKVYTDDNLWALTWDLKTNEMTFQKKGSVEVSRGLIQPSTW